TWRALRAERVVVHRLRQRVRSVELQAARGSLVRRHPEAVVVRSSKAGDLENVAERRTGPDRAGGRQRGERTDAVGQLVGLPGDPEPITLGAEIADHHAQAWADLTLDVDVVCLYPAAVEVRVDGVRCEPHRARGCRRAVQPDGAAERQRN